MKLKLGHKMLALLLLTGVVPLLVCSWLMIGIGHEQVATAVESLHRLEAGAAAGSVRRILTSAEDRLLADFESVLDHVEDEDVRTWLVYVLGRQDNVFTFRALAVHDAEGQPVCEPVSLPPSSIPEEHRADYLVTPEDVTEFVAAAPVSEVLTSRETQFSRVRVNPRRREALVAVSVPILGQQGLLKWVVSGDLSLRNIQKVVSNVTLGSSGHAYIVDGTGRIIAHPTFDHVVRRELLPVGGVVATALQSGREDTVRFVDAEGVGQLGAHAPIFRDGWQLVVQQTEADAFQPVAAMRARAMFILVVTLSSSLLFGFLYVRGLVTPVKQVMHGMRRVIQGRYDHRLSVRTGDEVGELAEAFNQMGQMLGDSRREIEAWNTELQDRVAAKTQALEKAQAQLLQSAKLSAIGQLGAGVAHELNNPLAGIVGQAALLERRLHKMELNQDERAQLLTYVGHVQGESKRCRAIIRGLLSLSETTSGRFDLIDLNESLNKLGALIENNGRANDVDVRHELGANLPRVEINEQQVRQVVLHVINNAFQAMPDGGRLTISTRASPTGALLEIADTGRGIPREDLDRVFDPFFTTKEVWESTGLGLSVCYSIIESHGGHMEIDSEIGRGTTVTLDLPLRATRPGKGTHPAAIGRREEAAVPVATAS
ncbi:MAG: ATP-binding protein [Acidobacteriota bacterium]